MVLLGNRDFLRKWVTVSTPISWKSTPGLVPTFLRYYRGVGSSPERASCSMDGNHEPSFPSETVCVRHFATAMRSLTLGKNKTRSTQYMIKVRRAAKSTKGVSSSAVHLGSPRILTERLKFRLRLAGALSFLKAGFI